MIWIILALAILLLPLHWIMAAMLAATVHELGHYASLRLCGVPVHELRIGVGGASMRVGQMDRLQTVICALAGPASGLFLLLFARWLPRTAVCACIQSAYNLLPVYPLDGGRVMRGAGIPPKVCRWVEGVCLGLIAFAGIYGCLRLHLGILPLFISVLTLRRALAGKGLEMRRGFRYNRGRINE